MDVDVDVVNAFYQSAVKVLEAETQTQVRRGELSVKKTSTTGHDITVIIGVTGPIQGMVLYGMPEGTARRLASTMLGRWLPLYDPLTESAVAELGNMITGMASAQLEEAGYTCNITPPTVVTGKGVIISTGKVPGLVIPVETGHGPVEVLVALEKGPGQS